MGKRGLQRKIRWIVYASLALIVLLAAPQQPVLKYMYPLRYKEVFIREAERYNVDPILVAAVMYVESHFDPKAVSPKGAIGLMQVMPRTGAWVAEKMNRGNWRNEHLYDPITNIQVGTWYLSFLLEKFRGESIPAIAAYNGGYANVQRWLATGKWDGTIRGSHRIPFPETRKYVARVMRAYEWYARAYPDLSQRTAYRTTRSSWGTALAGVVSAGLRPLLKK